MERRTLASVLGLVVAVACGAPGPSTSTAPSRPAPLRNVTLPDLSRVDASVQTQLRERYATLTDALKRPDATGAEKAAAFGAVGVLMHAGEYLDAAEPAYLNAQDLTPDEPRWPYFLAHLYKSRGETAKAMAAFTRVLDLRPSDAATLIWLGRLHLDQGQVDQAEPLFERARAVQPRSVAVLAGLGTVALERRDFSRAVSVLEEALTIDPRAASIHSTLATAYRGLGNTQQAETHVRQWRNTQILVPDPLRQELDLALQSGLSFELRGVRALDNRDFGAAADFFRQGVALTSGSTMLGRSLRHKLATTLYLGGDVRGAVGLFEETVRLAPTDGRDETAASAHYSLGVLMASAGRQQKAIEHLTAAVHFSPNHVAALQALGDALRRNGRAAASMTRYAELIEINPRAADARFGYGLALVRQHRHREARDWLEEARRLHPDRLDLTHALARLLAASPDDSIRDGARALALVQELLAIDKATLVGETMAMALAELGRFDEAVQVQRGVLDATRTAGLTTQARWMSVNLRSYERKQPCRLPWADDDPAHLPGPPVDRELIAVLQPARP
jgi:tetratricopeptide (TPR) repeat protein